MLLQLPRYISYTVFKSIASGWTTSTRVHTETQKLNCIFGCLHTVDSDSDGSSSDKSTSSSSPKPSIPYIFSDSLTHYLTCKRLWRAINSAFRGSAYVANILNLPNAKFEHGWRTSILDDSSPPVPADAEPLSPPVPVPATPSIKLCVKNTTVLSCTRLAVASIAYHELTHYHGLRNRNANFIASTTIKVVSAALKKVTSGLKTLSPSKDTTDEPSPIVPTFANILHFRSALSNNISPIGPNVFNNSHNFTSRSSDLIIGNSLRYPPSHGKTKTL